MCMYLLIMSVHCALIFSQVDLYKKNSLSSAFFSLLIG